MLLLDHVTPLFVAFSGLTVAVSCTASPAVALTDVLLSFTPVTFTVLFFTVMVQVAVFDPSSVFTVIFAVPAPLAVTFPAPSTVATDGLLLLHKPSYL